MDLALSHRLELWMALCDFCVELSCDIYNTFKVYSMDVLFESLFILQSLFFFSFFLLPKMILLVIRRHGNIYSMNKQSPVWLKEMLCSGLGKTKICTCEIMHATKLVIVFV